jgi:hypothetical protein
MFQIYFAFLGSVWLFLCFKVNSNFNFNFKVNFKMSIYPPEQSPPSYEDLSSNIYMTDIPRADSQSTLPLFDNPNSEACSNPNYPT